MQSTHIITHFQTSINVPNIQVEIITYTTIHRNIQRYNYSQWRQHYRNIEDTSATEGTFVGNATTDTGDS